MAKNDDYTSMMRELQTLLADMQAEELDVDAALKGYERGQELVARLERYLETAENKITQHKLQRNEP